MIWIGYEFKFAFVHIYRGKMMLGAFRHRAVACSECGIVLEECASLMHLQLMFHLYIAILCMHSNIE